MGTSNPYLLGFARVRLQHLQLDPMKHIDAKRVKRLIHNFKLDGCKNDDIAHAVPVAVDPATLMTALTHATLAPSALWNAHGGGPELDFDDAEKLQIFYGDHRLQAGKKFLLGDDRWWSVLLYDSYMPAKVRASILQGNRQESIALNGREMASFLGETDRDIVKIWLSKMSKTHESTFRRLREDDDGRLSRALQDVLRFRGLQYKAGNWEPILSMRCREEVYAYLHAIAQTWEHILGKDLLPDQLDETTVLELQMYLPAYSSQDCSEILKLFVNKKVFPLIQDVRARESIGRRVLSCKRIVTFGSFFKDFIYLRTCFDGLKALLPSTWTDNGCSFEQMFAHSWRWKSQSNNWRSTSEGNSEGSLGDFRECYNDLWLFAMREFPCLSDGKASQPMHDVTLTDDHAECWSSTGSKKAQLAYQASHFGGFETDEIEKLKASLSNEMPQDVPLLGSPEVSTNNDALRRRDRSNRPSSGNYAQCREFLYRKYVYDTSEVEQKKHATAYAVARDIVHCCWRPDIKRWLHDPDAERVPPNSSSGKSLGTARNKEPRLTATRVFEVAKQRRKKKNRQACRNLNDNQQLYEQLISEVERDFAGRQASNGIDSTPQDEWAEGPKGLTRATPIKEELQSEDDVAEGIEGKMLAERLTPIRSWRDVVDEQLRASPGTRTSGGSRYSQGQHEERESSLPKSSPDLRDKPSPSEYESIYGLPVIKPDQARSLVVESVLNGSAEGSPGAASSVHASDTTSKISATHRNRKSPGRRSLRKLSGSPSRSGHSGSTSWPRPHTRAKVSGSTDGIEPTVETNTILSTPLRTTGVDARDRIRHTVFPGGPGQDVTKKMPPVIAQFSERKAKSRRTVFPGQDGEVKAEYSKIVRHLRPKKRQESRTQVS